VFNALFLLGEQAKDRGEQADHAPGKGRAAGFGKGFEIGRDEALRRDHFFAKLAAFNVCE